MKIGLALAAALAPQRCWQKQPQKSTKLLLRYQIAITGIQSAENMKKNSKGIYYSNGNYEAFARPEKPEGVDRKNAYIVGSGLASLAAACFLVRDGQMPGSHIHILEAMDIAGGACDGIFDPAAAIS